MVLFCTQKNSVNFPFCSHSAGKMGTMVEVKWDKKINVKNGEKCFNTKSRQIKSNLCNVIRTNFEMSVAT